MRAALLVIDVQYEYFLGKLPITYPKDSFQNILKVIDAANANNLPVILIQHTSPGKDAVTFVKGSREWQLHEQVLAKPYAHIIGKHLPGSFTGTNLLAILRKYKADTVVICGYMTQMCCDTTSRQACHQGFAVQFLSDATGTLDIKNYAGEVTAEELQRSILVTQAMRFSNVMTADEWIKQLNTAK